MTNQLFSRSREFFRRLHSVNFVNFAALFLIAAAPPPSPDKLRGTVEKLVSFGTRHTASTTTDPKRGIGAARNWVAGEFTKLGLSVERPSKRFDGPRAPSGVIVEDVLGIQRGTGDPNHIVIVAGHIDSRVSDPMNATSDAPGANDDASGVALVMEAARLLSKERFSATIVYAVLSGEEQGLWGGKLLAETAKARGWRKALISCRLWPSAAPTASDAAGIIRRCSRPAIPPCASPSASRITTPNIRIFVPKTAKPTATPSTGWTFPISPK